VSGDVDPIIGIPIQCGTPNDEALVPCVEVPTQHLAASRDYGWAPDDEAIGPPISRGRFESRS